MLAKCRSQFTARKTGLLALAFSCVAVACALQNSNAAPKTESDVVCDVLLRDYVLNTGKIDSRSVHAATELLGIRGRGNEFWRVVLRHFKDSNANSHTSTQSSRLLTVLTIMLAYDGQARWILARPEALRESALIPQILLTDEVLDTIIECAAAADRNHLDAHVVAVVAGHDPRARTFLKSILETNDERIDQGTRFHAAVGLAELGDPWGFRWLVEASPSGEIWSAPHLEAQTGGCLESRIHSLNDLTGVKKTTIEEWQAWWKTQKGPLAAKGRVKLRYP